ncbi:MAG TPA: amidase family protein [Acidimicrobiia bacterium]|nr:amidase family protein [Acidimicrobiia bacterium]
MSDEGSHAVVDSPGQIDLRSASIADLQAAFDAGILSAEGLAEISLARVAAFDHQGPELNAVIHVDPATVLAAARSLDEERRKRGPRSPLHGIPVVLKDNIDTGDMPTTAGSLLLEGSVPPDDACIVRRLREAGALILGKVNMSEFAAGPRMSSIAGAMRNPHDLGRSPAGSSGGTGVAIAARYAQIGLGTDTGSSVRSPSTCNGIVGLRPTIGLLSRDGIVPLALTFDTAGPMARSVHDVAAMLGVMAGVDEADPATAASDGLYHSDYTRFLDRRALEGARLGLARDFTGFDADVDWIVEAAAAAMRAAGATVVDVRFPPWFLEIKSHWYTAIRHPEFAAQIAPYLATLDDGFPRTIADLIARSRLITSATATGGVPNPARWRLFEREAAAGSLTDHRYTAVRDHGLPMARHLVDGLMAENRLDAIVYPTLPVRPGLAAEAEGPSGPGKPADIASLTGFPDLTVPVGSVAGGLPIGLSFLGPAFSEPRLLGLGYSLEQILDARRDPVHAPPLPGEMIDRG